MLNIGPSALLVRQAMHVQQQLYICAQIVYRAEKTVHWQAMQSQNPHDPASDLRELGGQRSGALTASAQTPKAASLSAMVQFQNVGLRYATGPETLSDLSFTLQESGFYFLTGPSGAGKTSLLRLLYLALRPTRGGVRLFGEDVVMMDRVRLPGFRRRIGVVFQDFQLVPHLCVFDNVALPLRVAGVAERDLLGPVRDMLAWVGLADHAQAYPATLSGGEQQRVAIARAVIGRPELLVADEPTGNVDPEMAVRLLSLFEALNRLGTTVVVATHDVHLMSRVQGAQMMRLVKGRLSDPTGALRFPPKPSGISE
jgi:cell division transport system ATP-binding protein